MLQLNWFYYAVGAGPVPCPVPASVSRIWEDGQLVFDRSTGAEDCTGAGDG